MRHANVLPFVALLLTVGLFGCTGRPSGDRPGDDGGSGSDGSVLHDGGADSAVDTDAGPPDLGTPDLGGEACGTARCGTGTYCCAAACNLCLPNTMFCLADPCHDHDGGPPPPVDGGTHDAGDGGHTTGATCGGFGGIACATAEYCDYPISADCGFADGTGTCMVRPDACPDLFDPVCGCDGSTYSNSCDAHASGISVQYTGSCRGIDPPPPPPVGDCRTSPCHPGDTCIPCGDPTDPRTPWLCGPPGSGCAFAL